MLHQKLKYITRTLKLKLWKFKIILKSLSIYSYNRVHYRTTKFGRTTIAVIILIFWSPKPPLPQLAYLFHISEGDSQSGSSTHSSRGLKVQQEMHGSQAEWYLPPHSFKVVLMLQVVSSIQPQRKRRWCSGFMGSHGSTGSTRSPTPIYIRYSPLFQIVRFRQGISISHVIFVIPLFYQDTRAVWRNLNYF